MNTPPPPPPHGEVPKSSGLPPGKYDIFIIPQHSSGSGFLYLPSLKPNTNSFAAGFASALILVVIGQALAPAAQAWWAGIKGSGGAGMMLFVIAIAIAAWALGRTQVDGGPGPGGGPSGGVPGPDAGTHGNTHSGPQPNGYANAPPPPPRSGAAPGAGGPSGGARPTGGWQRSGPPPGTQRANDDTGSADGAAKGAWERAREETKRKEEERKREEAARKRREEIETKLREAREKEAREREAREKRQQQNEAQAKERIRKEKAEAEEKIRAAEAQAAENRRQAEARASEKLREAEARAREKHQADLQRELEKERQELELEREKEKARQREKEEKAKLWEKRKEEMRKITAARLQAEKDKAAQQEKEKAAAATKPVSSSYAFSATGEKTNPWPNGRPVSPVTPRSQPPSPTKRPPAPTAKTFRGTDEDAYSARPYDKPKPGHTKAPPSIFSESSYAASQSTSRTTPPPSFRRGPYTTKDPDKIVIKAVYSFNNAFQKTPVTHLMSGQGNVTDGLILRITTEGLFIDDDVRGVPQREWDVKAWTMKLVEVWCPSFRQGPAGNSASARVASASPKYNPVRRLWGMDKDKAATSEETDALLIDMLQLCQNNCRTRSTSSGSSAYSASSASSYDDASSVTDSAYGSSVGNKRTNQRGANFQTGENKSAGLHVLRASIRDQEGKKYVFIISAEESWKVAVGLQRLRRGTQVRALGVSGMSTSDAKATLEHLQWIT
ncbi:putative reticulocyte-binding protein 2 like protein a [Halenospora varia]|nr:putative reticulocyte-binding protein 2 like protein a [Halenospora varia]